MANGSRFVIRFKQLKFSGLVEFGQFLVFLRYYSKLRLYRWFSHFEQGKDALVDLLYKKRGRYVRPFLHFGAVGLVFLVITIGPMVLKSGTDEVSGEVQGVMTAQAFGTNFYTQQAQDVADLRGGEVATHSVQEGETLSSIALRYNLQVTTLLWANDLTETSKIKPGQELRILPVDGVEHKVSRGETLFSIAKKYQLITDEDSSAAQAIVDYPFNDFLNDETFDLATGQVVLVPGGIKPNVPKPTLAPVEFVASGIQGTAEPNPNVSASGQYSRPASGRVTQGYSAYHKAVDIANKGGGAITAADAGTVVSVKSQSSGYGNHIVVDHGNGFSTLYAHLSVVQVQAGQTVGRGELLGQMGSTGRSTGVHLHFEIRQGGVYLNPLSYLPR